MEGVKTKGKLKLPARAGVWSVISGLVARGVGVVGTPIFTRLLTPAEYGLYPLYTTWLSVFSSIFVAGMTGSAIYRGLQKFSAKREEFISAATGFGLLGCLAAFLLAIPLSGLFGEVTGLAPRLLFVILGEVALGAVIAFRSAHLRYEYKYRRLALTNLFVALGTPVISVAVVMLTPLREEARIIGSFTSTLAVALPTLAAAIRRGSLYNREIWRYLARVNLPLVPHYFSSSLILRASEMVIGRTHGQAALAKYSVGISVGLALTFISNALSQVTSPWIIRKVAEGKFDTVRELLTLALRALLTLTLMLLAVAPEILAVITTPEYADALPVVYPLSISVSAMFLSSAILSAEAYYERSLRSTLPTVVTAAVSIASAILILPAIDYRYSALFTLAAYLLLVVLSSAVFAKISGQSVLNPVKCILLFAFSVAYAAILFAFRGALISRILLAIPLIPYLISVGKSAWNMIKEGKSQPSAP